MELPDVSPCKVMEAAAFGIVKRVFIGTWQTGANRDLADAEECIFESNLPPMSDQDEDGCGGGAGLGGRSAEIVNVYC